MLEDYLDLDCGNWRKLNGRQGNGKVMESIHATIIGKCLCLAVVLDQGLAEKGTGETKEKGRNANQVMMWIHANYSRQSC